MTDDRLTLEQIELAIRDHYVWFSKNAPGVWPREEGHLANLWAMFDEMIAEGQGDAV